MSVELRIEDDAVVCDWGTIQHPRPRFDTDPIQVGPLCLVVGSLVDTLREDNDHGRAPRLVDGALVSLRTPPDGVFIQAETYGNAWIWELYPTRWWDGAGRLYPGPIYIGRCPD